MRLLLSPHPDDECLFASFTLLRYKPVVVVCTDYDIGRDGITAEERRAECVSACGVLGVPVVFLGIPESALSYEYLMGRLGSMVKDVMWTPAIEGGHPHHDIVGLVPSLFKYATYSKESLTPSGSMEIEPTDNEVEMKNSALSCYKSQLRINSEHFKAVEGKSEYYR